MKILNSKSKFLIMLGMSALCMVPFSAHASAPMEIINPFTDSQSAAAVSHPYVEQGGYGSNNFSDNAITSAVEVEPINDVTQFLPDETIYPRNITTSELLNLIKPKTDTYTIIDLETGISFEALRYGGNKHLDTEPKTLEDTKKLNSINGHSWDRRAIAVYFDGNFYAASMHTMPHGNGHISNNGYNGHICVHVAGSRTHGSNRVCEMHQGMVAKSANTDIAEIVSAIPALNNN